MTKISSDCNPVITRLFHGRTVVIATMHGKGLVMKPLIRQYLGLNSTPIGNFDTDQFGTFSGEVERPYDAVTTLRHKILKALSISGETLGIGNEGAFGPHPKTPFIAADQEIVMLVDLKHDIEIFEAVLSTETNYNSSKLSTIKELIDFADKVQFPSHGIILKQTKEAMLTKIAKGILTWEHLYSVFLQFNTADASVEAESDMRAYVNPTRMKIIERATEALLKRVSTLCPSCKTPGFGISGAKNGLPCRSCNEPTQLPMWKIYSCKRCGYHRHIQVDEDTANSMYCDHCNP